MVNPGMMKVLKDFNGNAPKPILTKTKMESEVYYPIQRAQRKKTTFGMALTLELEEYMLYLSERYSDNLDDSAIEYIKDNIFFIIKRNDNNLYLELNKA